MTLGKVSSGPWESTEGANGFKSWPFTSSAPFAGAQHSLVKVMTSQSTSEDTKRDLRNYSVKHLLVSLNMRKHDSNLNCGWKAIRTPLSRWPRKTIHGEPRSPRRKPLVSHEELGLKDGQDEGTWQYWVHFQAKELWLEQKKINLWDFSLQIYLIQYNEISMAIGSYGIVGTKGDVPVI
jgi:hypothetical protein